MAKKNNTLLKPGQGIEEGQLAADILEALKLIHGHGGVFEVCVASPKVKKHRTWGHEFAGGKAPMVSGWFRDLEKAANIVAEVDNQVGPVSIYMTLNPVSDALLGRAQERLKANSDRTRDADVTRRLWIYIDLDPIRPKGVSASDKEKEAAKQLAREVWNHLLARGWPEPIVADSGNGVHLIFRVDLPNDEESQDLVKRILRALAHQLDTSQVSIDTAVCNASRLIKLPGTVARKGDHTDDRPHRRSGLLQVPEQIEAVPAEKLQELAALAPNNTPQRNQPQAQKVHPPNGFLDVAGYLAHYGIECVGTRRNGDSTLFLLRECVFDPTHTAKEAAIGQKDNGQLFYHCFHDSCQGRTWREARQITSGDEGLSSFWIGGSDTSYDNFNKHPSSRGQTTTEDEGGWAKTRLIAPRVPFPWDILPEDVANSLQALARSCATGAEPLPGMAFSIIAASLGSKINVSPKPGWEEAVILWFIDIRESGEGKTPPMWSLSTPLVKKQQEEQELYRQRCEEWQRRPKRNRGDPPPEPRGFYCTDLTLEGLRADLEKHPTGGIIALLNEASELIGAQNQYKQKGTDREAWLKLHDGKPARIVRANKTIYIHGARVQVVGGIQPSIFKKVFGGEGKQYLSDGTVYRCLFCYSPPQHYDLDLQGWEENMHRVWEDIVYRSLEWANNNEKNILLTMEAQNRFLKWRNELNRSKYDLPKEVRGFLPKTYGYALRLAAVIHCIHQFHNGEEPQSLLSGIDIERGINSVMFYLGQAVEATRLLLGGQEHVMDSTQTKIIEALKTNNALTASQINKDVFKNHIKAEQLHKTLGKLKKSGYIEETEESTSGRKRTLFSLPTQHNSQQETPDNRDNSLFSHNSQGCSENNNEVEDEIIL